MNKRGRFYFSARHPCVPNTGSRKCGKSVDPEEKIEPSFSLFVYGFTLLETLIVLVIVAILVSFALPQYVKAKERALDKEARANIRLIQAGEQAYKIDMNKYWPDPASSESNITKINSNLTLDMPASGAFWNYTVSSVAQTVTAKRVKTGGRELSTNFTSDTINCAPNSDTCL